MEAFEQIFLQIIHDACTNKTSSIDIQPQDLDALLALVKDQSCVPYVLPYLNDKSRLEPLKYQTKLMMLNYCQIDQFTRRIAVLFEANQIPYVLLKGISLAAFYPVPEYRKLGDVDLYINERAQFERAGKLLLANGFKKDDDVSDHHQRYFYTFPKTDRILVLELHFRIVGLYQYAPANRIVDAVFGSNAFQPEHQVINKTTYPVLPPTQYTFYMLHHMLKHYLYNGFGIRLLCDFTFYLEHFYNQIDFDQIHSWCRDSKILHLYEIILETCRIYLGLPETIDSAVHYDPKDCEAFLQQLLAGGDVNKANAAALVGSTSYNRVTPFTYLKEGHLQMHVRFPKLGKCPLLWPVLWAITFVCFLHNTYTIRNTTLRKTLRSFKQDNQRSKLLRIFDNTDD